MNPLIRTVSNKVLNPFNPRKEDIDIRDIAHALALTNRFNGHTLQPISVAQHSVNVSFLCQLHPLNGLLHDASEAFLGDVTKWIKATPEMEQYRRVEEEVQNMLYGLFGCSFLTSAHEEVAINDKFMVRFEHEVGFGTPADIPGFGALTAEEKAWINNRIPFPLSLPWQLAEKAFLDRYRSLKKK